MLRGFAKVAHTGCWLLARTPHTTEGILLPLVQDAQVWVRAAATQGSSLGLQTLHTGLPSSAAQPAIAEEQKVENEDKHKPNEQKTRKEGYMLSYPRYNIDVEKVQPKHKPAEKLYQKTAYAAVTAMRWSFDTVTGYPRNMTEARWLNRIVFLETIAGVPGMVGGMLRHMKSLRSMQRDNGWIHTLLEEAENERMHLLTFLQLKQPGPLFRAFVLLSQGVFFNLYTLFYIISPKHCHAFVGYLEEQAVLTYTHAIKDIDDGRLPWADKPPPEIAISYWGLPEGATMRDLILAVRADEASHAKVNHTFSVLKPSEANPYEKGAHDVA